MSFHVEHRPDPRPLRVQLDPSWHKPDADELRARRRRLIASATDGPYRPEPLRWYHRIHRALAWWFGGGG